MLPKIQDNISGLAKSHSSKINVFPSEYETNSIPGIKVIELSFL